MNLFINGKFVNVIEYETDIDGLKFRPQFDFQYNNDSDWESFTLPHSQEVSQKNYNLVKEITSNYMTHGVMEIGISRNGDGSFTNAILNNKPDNIPYLGVDIEDKTYLNNESKKIFTIKENSFNQRTVRNYAKKIGLEKISILFIDGWHSLNAAINDWMYSDMLSDNGIIIIHDTNGHPGPYVLMESIDNTKYRLEKHFQNDDDYGIGIAYKLNNNLQQIFKNYDSYDRLELNDDHCGPGSTLWYTQPIRNQLVPLLKKNNINSMLDAPCGDFQWASKVEFPEGFDYLGGDLHESLIQRNKRLYNNNFMVIDITKDKLPSKDLIFVRDCLFHLTDELKFKFFKNFLSSNFKYILTSNHPRHNYNKDVSSFMDGHFHENINWELPPWNFPKSIDTIIDYDETNSNFSYYPYRTMELWTFEQIKSVFKNYIV